MKLLELWIEKSIHTLKFETRNLSIHKSSTGTAYWDLSKVHHNSNTLSLVTSQEIWKLTNLPTDQANVSPKKSQNLKA